MITISYDTMKHMEITKILLKIKTELNGYCGKEEYGFIAHRREIKLLPSKFKYNNTMQSTNIK